MDERQYLGIAASCRYGLADFSFLWLIRDWMRLVRSGVSVITDARAWFSFSKIEEMDEGSDQQRFIKSRIRCKELVSPELDDE